MEANVEVINSKSLDAASIYGDQPVGNSGADNQVSVPKLLNEPHLDRDGSVSAEGRKRIRKERAFSDYYYGFKRHRNGPARAKKEGLGSRGRKRKYVSSSTGVGKGKYSDGSTPAGNGGTPIDLNGVSDNLCDPESVLASAPPAKKESDQASSAAILEILDVLDSGLVVPKWSRGVKGRKRSQGTKRTRGASASSDKNCVDGEKHKSPASLEAPSRSSTDELYKNFDEFEDNGSSKHISFYSIKGANDTTVKANKRKVRSRKKQVSAVETQTPMKNKDTLLEDCQKSSVYLCDEDGENLEETAARMLSSRFDPRCTGFPATRMASSKPVNESSSRPSSKSSKASDFNLSSVDPENRSLRPRRNRCFVRKRRHFYEVSYSNMDPYWVVTQRIRVLWPLDQNWYFGLVKDYDPVTKLHYIKYDDWDTEWVNLQNERFKLLLFPSEIKFNSERSRSRVQNKNEELDKSIVDDNCMGASTESETIMSRLARANPTVKSPSCSIQKHRSVHLLGEFEPSILSAPHGCLSLSSPTLPERVYEGQLTQLHKMEINVDSSSRKLSFVYSRKRFNRKHDMIHKHEDDTSCTSLTGPISLLASVADGESALEELYASVIPSKEKQITFKLCLPPLGINHHAFGSERNLLFSTFLHHHGKVVQLWPKVHMQLALVDSALGLRWLSFEGCLRLALELVCLVMATFYQNGKPNRSLEIQAPYTSIGFELSGLRNSPGRFLFTLCSFLELSSKKWRYLENKLKQQCRTIGDLPIEECTYVNTKTLSSRNRSKLVFNTSIFEYPISSKFFSTRSCSDIMQQLIRNKSASLSVNPGLCYFDEDCRMFPPSAHYFAPAPLFVVIVHLNMLMKNNSAAPGFQEPNSISFKDRPENYDKLTGVGYSPLADSSVQVSETSNEKLGSAAASSGWLSIGHSNVDTDSLSASSDKASDEAFFCSERSPYYIKSQRGAKNSCSPFYNDSSYQYRCEAGYNSSQLFSQVEESFSDKEQRSAHDEPDLIWNMNEHIIRSPTTTAPRSIWHRSRHSSVLATFGQSSKLWPGDFVRNGFVNSSKKPRTQVSYSSRIVDGDLGSEHRSHFRKERIYKKTKSDNVRRLFSVPERPDSYVESLICYANVLVTTGDRGWRECGAQVILDSDGQKDCMLSVKFSGITKYVHKAHQFLQPGITNRYTYAMMWKGGKDWTLEFTDRNQWSLFKVMYQECFNRNIRAASVKNIPIPGVRLIDEGDDNSVEVPFIRSSSKYYRQVGTEVDLALDPCQVMYDMDSSDEEWVSNLRVSSEQQGGKVAEVTYDMFERVMDMFEKLAYGEQSDRFTSDEIEEFLAGFGPMDVIKDIYEHWHQKRRKKGLPLLRQFQPPLWQHYQKKLKEWELTMSKIHGSSDACQEKTCLLEKPPMFAFCLRPRGLIVPNKGSKQKSHRKFMYMGHHNSFTREMDGSHGHGRKLTVLPVGEDKPLFDIQNHEFLYTSDRLQSPSRVLSKDAERSKILTMTIEDSNTSQQPKLYRSNSKKNGMPFSPGYSQILPTINIEKQKRNGVSYLNADTCEWPSKTKRSQPHGLQKRHQQDKDVNELRLRDASSAAKHASKVAKDKRAKSQWLMHKSDLALHKARAALMAAEVIKSSQEDLIGNG